MNQTREPQSKWNNLAQQMQRISKSRSKSKTFENQRSSGGQLDHQIKSLEKSVGEVVAQKQTALQQNLALFKEKMAKQRQEKEQTLIDISN